MSVKFFEDMAEIKKSAHEIQMLEGSHPYVGDTHKKSVKNMASELRKIEDKMRGELKKRFAEKKTKKK